MISTFLTLALFFQISTTSIPSEANHLLAEHTLSLENRQSDKWVNEIFKENILLNLAYMRSTVDPKQVNWDEIKKEAAYEFKLEPNQTFAFHEDVLPEYKGKVAKTTNAHFNFQEGFKSDGFLVGDGVCHFASLLYWAAKDANLETQAPTNHDFMPIPDVPKEYGVSIYNFPGRNESNARQNLYITNNKSNPVTFKINYKDNSLKIEIIEENSSKS